VTKQQVNRVIGQFRNTTNFNLGDERATNWLATNLTKIKTTMRQKNYIDNTRQIVRKQLTPGKMVFFGYNPKTKDELMFWDEFPVTIILHPQKNGFLGLNLHYLPPSSRASFLNKLLKYVSDPNWVKHNNTSVEFRVTYGLLKNTAKMSAYRPCIKRYYYSHIITKVAYIEPQEWKMVPFFPLDKFKGASRADVWALA
jgi:hypothetical protein